MLIKIGLSLAVLVIATSAVPHSKVEESKRPNIPDVDYYNCVGKPDGNYDHPSDCTRFISCSNGRAFDMACPACGNNPSLCAGQEYLFYRHSTDQCDWPKDTPCSSEPTDKPSTTHASTLAPTTHAPTTHASTHSPTTHAPSTEASTPGVPSGPEDFECEIGNQTWTAGDDCTEKDCQPCGFCLDEKFYYLRCVHTVPEDPRESVTGVVKLEECGAKQYWNPERRPAGVQAGGSCDHWEGLNPIDQDRWLSDDSCNLPTIDLCKWGQDEECSANHWFYDPKVEPNYQSLVCPGGLLWDPESEGCQPCNKPVKNSKGDNCSC